MELQKEQEGQFQQQSQEQQQVQAQIEQLEVMIKQFLSKEALQRYGNQKLLTRKKQFSYWSFWVKPYSKDR